MCHLFGGIVTGDAYCVTVAVKASKRIGIEGGMERMKKKIWMFPLVCVIERRFSL